MSMNVEKKYMLVINGYDQLVMGYQPSLEIIIKTIELFKSDVRIKDTDSVAVRTVITYTEEL